MLVRLHSQDVLSDFGSLQSQLVLEKDLQQFFKVTPPTKIESEFGEITGSATHQFQYLILVLKVIEELDVEPVQAFALLEAVRPVIYRKVLAVTSRFVGKTVLVGSKTSALVFEAIEVFARLTDTYDSIIHEARHFGDSQVFIMGSAIHRALSDKARLIQCYLLLYLDVPPSVWKHLGRLYHIADEYNVFNQTMPDKLAFPDVSLTVRQVYLYIMLLASSGSRNLVVEDIAALAEHLKDWVKLVALKKYDPASDALRLCMDPASMQMPALSCTLTEFPKSLFCFDFDKLVEKLQKTHVHQRFVDGARYTLPAWTTARILNNWTVYQPRLAERSPCGEEKTVLVCVGMANSWRLAGLPDEWPDEAAQSERDFAERKLDFTLGGELSRFAAVGTLQQNHPAAKDNKVVPVLAPKIVDISNTGYCLEWQQLTTDLAVDEMVVLYDKVDGHCKLGQVVWIRYLTRTRCQTGISILSTEVIPVLMRPVKSRPGATIPGGLMKGFVISNPVGARQHFGILAGNVGLQAGQVLELRQDQAVHTARLLEPLNRNGKYQSFNMAFFQP